MAATSSKHSRPIALIGMMGAGKTSIGRALAAHLGWAFADTDEQVEQAAGCSIAEIFAREGEAAFREREHRALARLLADSNLVLATGGGAVIDPRSRELLRKRARTIWLDAAPATLALRLGDAANRPLLGAGDREGRLTRLLEERRLFYGEAQLRIEADGLTEAEVLARLLAALRS